MIKQLFFLIVLVVLIPSPNIFAQLKGNFETDSIVTFLDKRDRRTYRAIQINDQVWMAENLRHRTNDSWCYKGKGTCQKYGRLYSWNDAVKACPKGWHLPSNEEWEKMINFLGGDKKAGYALAYDMNLAFNSVFGQPPNINGRYANDDNQTNYWSSTPMSDESAYSYYLIKNKLPLVLSSYFSKEYNMNCRCVLGDAVELPEP